MCTWDAVGAPGAISQRLTKEGVVADRPGLRVKSVPLPGLCNVLRVNVSPRNLGSLAKVPGNHMSKVGEPLLAADWSQSGSQTSDPGHMCGGLPAKVNKQRIGDAGQEDESAGARDNAPRRPMSGEGPSTHRGNDTPEPGGGEEPLFTASDATPLPQRNKRKGEELTPPDGRPGSEEELFQPRQLGGKAGCAQREGPPRQSELSTTEDELGEGASSEQEEEGRVRRGLRPKGKKRRKATPNAKPSEGPVGMANERSERDEPGPSTRPATGPAPPAQTTSRQPKPQRRTVASSLEGSPEGVGPVEYWIMSAADLGAQIREWLEETDAIRVKCRSISGRLSGDIKKRLSWAKEALLTLTGKAVSAYDPAPLRARNTELTAQLRKAEREKEEAQRELAEVKRELERAKEQAVDRSVTTYALVTRDGGAGGEARATSRADRMGQGRALTPLNVRAAKSRHEGLDPAAETPTPGSAPDSGLRLTEAELGLLPASLRERETALERQLTSIGEVWKELRKMSRQIQLLGDMDRGRVSQTPVEPEPPATTSGIIETRGGATDTPREGGEDGWTTVGNGRRNPRRDQGEAARAEPPAGAPAAARQTAARPTGGQQREGNANAQVTVVKKNASRRPPRSAAVAIKGTRDNVNYGDILRRAREKISLTELEMPATKIRRSANGGVLIEVAGPDGAQKADVLAAHLGEMTRAEYGDAVRISRPTTKGEIRVLGMDDSVTAEELGAIMAATGGCGIEAVKVGPLREMTNGLRSAWVLCPLRAATKIAAKGKIPVGWTTVRVNLLEARPRQCFRCWQFGHIGATCKAPKARGAACYRCGGEGHQARTCTAAPRCAICAERGGNSAHRMGFGQCPAVEERGRRPAAVTNRNGQAAPREAVRSADRNQGVIVGGDFNARSPAWDPTGANRRGEILESWAASLGLCLLNTGATATCVRPQGCSVVDTTWATPGLAVRVRGWRVLAGIESLSDHRYIAFEVVDRPQAGEPPPNRGTTGHRWNLNKFKEERFHESLALQLAWGPTGPDRMTANGLARWIGQAMIEACDAAAPRSRPPPHRKSVHWWTDEVAELRRACIRTRRRMTRRDHTLRAGSLWEAEYKEAKRKLREGIKAAKARAWQDLISAVETDPWGLPYRMVFNRLRGSSPGLTETLDPAITERLLSSLFPHRASRGEDQREEEAEARGEEGWRDEWAVSPEEVRTALKKGGQRNTAPGLDGVKGKIWAIVPDDMVAPLAQCYSKCLQEGEVPREWKTARLVLIPKGGSMAGDPLPKVRPICLLSEISKGFERVVVERLKGWMAENPAADLAEGQYGFREGRATVPWGAILTALKDREVPRYLRRVTGSYLSDREVIFSAPGGTTGRYPVRAGVPQGSVLGPLLWNLCFDGVLRVRREEGCDVLCYADDTLVLSSAGDMATAIVSAEVQVATVVRRINRLGLTVSATKTQVVAFTKGRERRHWATQSPCLRVGGEAVAISSYMQYLGITLDAQLNFREHFARVESKVAKSTRALFRLMPNLRAPTEQRRRLYAEVIYAIILYGAPAWRDATSDRAVKRRLQRMQRTVQIRVASAYRTVSLVAASMLTRSPPLDLVARARARTFQSVREQQRAGGTDAAGKRALAALERAAVAREWRADLSRPNLPSGRVRGAILVNWEEWLSAEHGGVTFHLTQIATGHGCFESYLHKIGRAADPVCKQCGGAVDTAEHTVEACPAWETKREQLRGVTGADLTLPALVKVMTRSREGWAAVSRFASAIMREKEQAERMRQRGLARAAERVSSDTGSGG
nr:uncharacterized protein LOC124223329 [Neodiprion pinetum]